MRDIAEDNLNQQLADFDDVKTVPICNYHACIYEKEYYGYRCKHCGQFIPYGCETWVDVELDWLDIDDDAEAAIMQLGKDEE